MAQTGELTAGQRKWPRMSYEEYLCDPTVPEASEWVDGEVLEMMSVSQEHVRVQKYLVRVLDAFLDERPLGETFQEPFNMKTGPDLPGRAPDIIFVANEHRDRLHRNHLEGPADVVVEVVSPGTEQVDRGAKFYEYEAGGVCEYWLIDPHREVAEFFVRDEHGVFRSAQVPPDGEFASTVIEGFRLKVAWLWSRPPVRKILGELIGLE